jgi:cytochrome c-type biogenesis protein
MSYLAGNAKQIDEEGTITYKKSTVFLHTVFFVMGISFAFFLLGMAFTALGSFFNKNQILFTRIGGIIITVLGLYQVGLFDFKVLKKERKIRLNINISKMNPLIAFLMGFTFSFAWTPCVGPALSSVLILASSAKSSMIANLLIILYSLGFVIPFLLIGLFTTQVLSFLKAKQKLLKYTVKIGGILLIIIGIMTFTGWMNGISKYLNKVSQPFGSSNSQTKDDSSSTGEESPDNNSPSNIDSQVPDNTEDIINKEDTNNDQADHEDKAPQEDVFPAIDFSLTDQYGNIHTLSDYKGKVVFLNFWATWCPPCVREMPDIEKIYKEYGENNEDVIILGVANPSSSAYPNNADESKEDIIAFLDDNNYSFPVVFDETGDLLREYYINAFPTTFLIDKNGNVYGYVPAMLTKDMMDNVIQETLDFTN